LQNADSLVTVASSQGKNMTQEINHIRAFYNALHPEFIASTDFEASLQKMLDWAEAQIPHPSWQALKALDFGGAVAKVAPWLSRVLKRAPCPFPVKGIYFGLGEFENKSGVEYTDLYFGLMGQCDFTDRELNWLWGALRHYPDSAYLRSAPLKAGGIICNKDESGLGTTGHVIFSLSFCALLLKAALNSKIYSLLGADEPVGLVLGFDSGDLLFLGSLQAAGLVVNTDKVSFAY
jgi:hypothetical protein